MDPMSYATNPLRSNKTPMAEMMREIFNPSPKEIAAWQRQQKINASIQRAAIAKLKREGKW